MDTDSPPSTDSMPVNTIRVETALSRYPVHRLARKGSIKIEVNESNERGEATLKWKVSYNSEYGQPGPLAYKLDTLIINRRIEEARRPIPRMLKLGSLSDICRELGLADSGKNRSDIKRSLFQNAFAGITSRTEYRRNDGTEQTLEAAFTRYSVILTGEKLPGGKKADGVYIVLNDVFIQVINGAMARPLDYDYLKSLPPAPQRFYELLSFQMYAALKYDRPRARITYSDFCAHAPQTRHLDWEHARSQMNKILKPHKESGYIAKVDYQDTTDGEGRPDWVMLFMPGPKARAEYRAFTKRGGPSVLEIEPLEFSPPLNAADQAERDLVERGVTAAVAAELVREHAEEKIRAQMERMDWLTAKQPEKIAEPAAYLVQAIKNDYAPPKGYISLAERQRRQEARQAKERDAAEKRRRELELEQRKSTLLKLAGAHIQRLDPAQLQELEAEALAQAGLDMRLNLENPAMAGFRKTLMTSLLREFVAAKLERDQVDA
ncbi:hypothetical protein [Paludisphaera mucosa]|uniref:Replication initiator protein A n=1 Tax=Paludisphaera mucosa TaxID=3030827 RepID=A0ABT6FLB7_9BACT|nr:hypothetical protein [Paludisphaera mucosa]MDG3008370.1 hypothetical protein [Paludisphaera mucosa]